MIVDCGGGAAQQPAGWISHCDGDYLVANMGHSKQVYLTEGNKGREHNNHTSPGVACTSKCACIHLIDAAKHIEGRQPPQEKGCVGNNGCIAVKDGSKTGGKNDHGDH